MVRPAGIEPAQLAPEASTLSTELRTHNIYILYKIREIHSINL